MNVLHIQHARTQTQLSTIDDLIIILQSSGCRISELLNVRYCDFISETSVIVHGLKGSASRIVSHPLLSRYYVNNSPFPNDPIFRFSYATVYRECLRRGYFTKHKNNKNRSVTHSFRYKYISSLNDVARNTKEVADCIGHRSKKTSEQYLAKEKCHG